MADPEKVKALIAGLSGAWEPAVLLALEDGSLRSAELRRAVSRGLDYRVFRDTVLRLVDRELVNRVERGPLEVSYQLTDAGRSVVSFLNDLETWAEEHPDDAVHVYRRPPAQNQ